MDYKLIYVLMLITYQASKISKNTKLNLTYTEIVDLLKEYNEFSEIHSNCVKQYLKLLLKNGLIISKEGKLTVDEDVVKKIISRGHNDANSFINTVIKPKIQVEL